MATVPDDDYSPDEAFRLFPQVPIHRVTDTEESLQEAMDFEHILAVDPVDLELNASAVKTLFNYTFAPNDTWIFGASEDPVVVPLLLALIGVVGLIGNGLVLASFVALPRMRSGQNVMILNVSLADLAFIVLAVPVAIVNHSWHTGSDEFVLGPGLCSFVHYMVFVCFYVTVYTLVVTSVFRFFGEVMRNGGDSTTAPAGAVVRGGASVVGYAGSPATIAGVTLSVCNASVSCIVIWVAFLTSHLNFVVNRDGAIFQQPFICRHTTDLQLPDPAKLRTLWVTFLACAFLFPLVIVCALSAVILHRQSRPPPPPPPTMARPCPTRDDHYEAVQNSLNDRRNKRELTMVIMASTVARSLSWLPIQIYLLVDAFASLQPDDVYRKAEMFGVCFAFAGACINPLIYNWASAEFRHAFRQVCVRVGCRRSGGGGTGGRPRSPCPGDLKRKPVGHGGTDLNETIMSIISDSSNHINYA